MVTLNENGSAPYCSIIQAHIIRRILHFSLYGLTVCGIYLFGHKEMEKIDKTSQHFGDTQKYQQNRIMLYEGFILMIAGIYAGKCLL